MLQKLRTDITKKLLHIKLLLINVKIFDVRTKSFDYGDIWPNKHDGLLDKLKEFKVDVKGFSPNSNKSSKIAKDLGINTLVLKSGEKNKILSSLDIRYSLDEIVFFGFDVDDLELMRSSSFCLTTISAPIEVKMECDYVSNFDGIEAMEEIGNLIINAKTDHNGYSK